MVKREDRASTYDYLTISPWITTEPRAGRTLPGLDVVTLNLIPGRGAPFTRNVSFCKAILISGSATDRHSSCWDDYPTRVPDANLRSGRLDKNKGSVIAGQSFPGPDWVSIPESSIAPCPPSHQKPSFPCRYRGRCLVYVKFTVWLAGPCAFPVFTVLSTFYIDQMNISQAQ